MGAPPWWPAECWNVPPKGIDSCGTALGIVQSHKARRNARLETLFRPARPAGGRGRGAEEAWRINASAGALGPDLALSDEDRGPPGADLSASATADREPTGR